MGNAASVAASGRYVVTEQGKYDLLTADTCQCDPKLAGLLFTCTECGTVYGSLRNSGPWNGRRGDAR